VRARGFSKWQRSGRRILGAEPILQHECVPQAAGVGQQVADRDPAPMVGPFGDVLSYVVVQRQLPAFARSRILIAVNCLDIEAAGKTDAGLMGTPDSRLPCVCLLVHRTPFLLTPKLQPGESGLFHCAKSLSILEATDSAGDRLAVAPCKFPEHGRDHEGANHHAVMTKNQGRPASRFMILIPEGSSVSPCLTFYPAKSASV